ncbi:MAG: HAD family hydrolase [Dehalococcoidia bacterium]|nr:HAD family hydrolase [Dehalococcoidia bacterium]
MGTCGFKARPDADGSVEIAYFTFPQMEGRGYGIAMAETLIALVENAGTVHAHTLRQRNASTSILQKAGMRFVGNVNDPEDGVVWRWERAVKKQSGKDNHARAVTQAVIFDMDGVLTDSESYYYEAVNVVLAGHGLHLTEKENEVILGLGVKETWMWLVEHFRLTGPLEQWLATYDREVLPILKAQVTPAPGLSELVAGFQQRKLRLGLASSSQRNWIEAVLQKVHLPKTFEVIVAGDEVEHGKPDPEIYISAAQQLGVRPEQCLVIEDSPTGIRAGKAAGMTVVAVLTPYTHVLDLSRADHVIASLKDFDWSVLA